MSGVDLAHAVASFDVLVLPRKKELDCHGVRRALAGGVPVIGLARGGVTDLVADACDGLLVDPERVRSLARAVERVREDRALLGRLAGHARASVQGRTWGDAYDDLADVHWSAVSRDPPFRSA